jgi:hypothetical protein
MLFNPVRPGCRGLAVMPQTGKKEIIDSSTWRISPARALVVVVGAAVVLFWKDERPSAQ